MATDSDEVIAAVRGAGGEAVMTRADHPSGTDRAAEVAAMPAYVRHEVVLNVQGDEPFIAADAVRAAVELVASGRFPLGTVACRDTASILAQTSVVKVVSDANGRAMYFSRAPIPFLRDPADARVHAGLVLRHVGLYAYSRDALLRWVALPPAPLEVSERLEQLRPLAAGIPMGVAVTADAGPPGIDTEDDLRRANAAWTTHSPTASSPVPAGIR